jgi:hypothetical protein
LGSSIAVKDEKGIDQGFGCMPRASGSEYYIIARGETEEAVMAFDTAMRLAIRRH